MKKLLKFILPFFAANSIAAPISSLNGGTNYNNSNAYHLQFTSNVNLPADINLQNAYNNDISKFITFFPLQGFAFKNSSGNNVEVWLENHITEFKPVTVSANGSDAILMLGTEDSGSTIFQVKSSQWGSNPFPYMTSAEKNSINLTNAKPGWGVFDTDQNAINILANGELQQLLSAQHINGTGSVTVTNNGDGTVTIFGAGSDAPDSAYASFGTQNNSTSTTFPAMNTFKPVYLGNSFSVDKATDFTNQFLTIDSVNTPVMTYTGATTQTFNVDESFSVRGAVAATASYKFCIAVRLANGTVTVTDFCQLATVSNLIDFIPGPKLVGNVELSTGDSVFAEVQNITNSNSIYVAFSNYLTSSIAGSIPNTNGLPQGSDNKYLSTDGGTTLASATGAINNGHLAQFSGTSGLVEDSGVSLADLGLQYFYDNNPYYPYQELVLDEDDGELDIYAGASGINISTTGVHVSGSLSENNTLGYFRVGPYSIDPASTMMSIECYPDPINKPCGALPYPHLSSALEASIPTGSAPIGLGIYNSNTLTLDLWDGSAFRKFLSSNQFSGDITVNTSGAATIANLAVTNAKIANSTIDVTTKITGVVPGANGGAPGTYAVGDLLYANTTSTLARRAAVASGQVLASAGASTAPVWTGTPTLAGLTIDTGNLRMSNRDIYFRGGSDTNHGVGWYSTSGKTWTGFTQDGPILYGFSGGGLGINVNGTLSLAAQWTPTLFNIYTDVSLGGDLFLPVGKSVTYKTGTNACVGTFTLASGTATVNTTCAKTGDVISLMKTAAGGTNCTDMPVISIVNATSFTASCGTADSSYSYVIQHTN